MAPRALQYPAIARVLSARAEVRLAALFGSNATGRAHAASDVDIAILPLGDPPLSWVIDAALAGRMVQAAGLRNRLAHGYASVDVDRLWTELPTGLDAIEKFTMNVAAFVGRSGSQG